MPRARSIAIPCRLSRGACRGECTYEIGLLDGSTHTGVASADHFRQPDGAPIDEGDLPTTERAPALLAAYLIGEEGGCALVSVPEGFVGLVDRASLRGIPDRDRRG